MRKLKLLFAACALFGAMTANAQVMIETDLTSQFNSLATTQWTYSSGQVGWAAPQVTTNSGLTVAAWERYNGSCDWTGDIMYSTVTGLAAGTYKIELYGAAAFTFGRGFGSEAFTGDFSKDTSNDYTENQSITENTGVTLYATTSEGTVQQEIPIWYATNFNKSGIATATLNNVVVGSNGEIKIGLSKTSKSTNWHVVQLKGVTATVDAEALFAGYKAEAEGLYNSPMNATVLNELKNAANVDLSTAGGAEYKTAIETLSAKITAAKASIAVYEEAKAILDAASTFDTTGQETYFADETIAALKKAYEDGTLESITDAQRTAAQEALATACKAQVQPADGAFMTPYIVNPSFESELTGWTNNGMAKQTNDSFEKEGNIYCEAWQPNGTKSVSQALTLLAGYYKLSAKVKARGVTSAKLFAGENETDITVEDATNVYSVEFACTGGVTIGFEGIGTGAANSWLCVDDFQLTYVRQLTAEEEAAVAKPEYDKALDAAKAIASGTIPAKNYAALQLLINNYTLGDGATAAQYEAATAKLNEATAAATALVEPYATWKQLVANGKAIAPQAQHPSVYNAIELVEDYVEENLIDAATLLQFNTMATTLTKNYSAWLELLANAVSLKNVSNNNAAANATLADEITTQSTAISGASVTSLDEVNTLVNTTIPTATSTLKAAMTTYATTVQPTNDEFFDLTFLIVNPHFTEGEGGKGKVASGWTLESGSVTEHRLATHNFEAWHAHFNLSQTIPGLPEGTYKVTLQGFARHDDASVTDKTNLYCGKVNQQIKDIKAEYSTTSFYNNETPALGDTNRDSFDGTYYRPNGMTGAYYWFSQVNPETGQPFYTNEVQTLITTAGDLKIGFKCEADKDWVIWDNFHLYYYGTAIAVDLDEAVGTSYTEDIEKANVTLKKTILAGLNTIVLPFAADPSEFNGTALYEFDGYEGTTLKFKTATTIEPNVPYLLDASADATGPFTFNDVTVKAATDLTSGTDAYQFVGTYQQIQVADGDYILGDDGTNGVGFYRSAGGNKVKAYRAYIKKAAPAGDAARLVISIDGVTTAIDAIDGQPINNAVIYNLAGQKVKNAQKGLYIQNGKKVVIK